MDLVAEIIDAIRARAEREGLWDMPLREMDLDALALEIAEVIPHAQG